MQHTNYFPNQESLIQKLSTLPKKDTTLIMADFDDTIFSRYEQLKGESKESKLLIANRGNKGNEVIKNEIGIEKFIDIFYTNKKYPKTIVSKMQADMDLILTAGFEEIQRAKIQATVLSHFPLEVVLHGEEKPQRLVEYIISLGFIPSKVEVYEDRPEHFLKAREEFEEITKSSLHIFLVIMKDNKTPPEIRTL